MTTYHGGCLCGAVRFSVEVSKAEIDACHCSMCRRWGGGPSLNVQADGPPRFEDEAALGVYRSSQWGERVFCKTCGSSVLWRSADGSFHAVPAAIIGDPEGMALALEIFIDDKPAYYDFAGERKRMTGPEVMAAFGVDTGS
ncbi:GFA family protein [Afifella pfennigii]|uniref:GFA family protein n=1 Tax=Afifella pfennigii TaxID=209897 RepID=UPI000478A534|nr:GFA family protein [Afifella pfennigii]